MLRNAIKISIALAITFLFTQTAFASNVGSFNFGVIMQQSAVAKSADAELQAQFGTESQAMDAEFTALQQEIGDFQRQAAALSENARREKQQELEAKSFAFEQKRQIFVNSKLAPVQQGMEITIREILQVACSNYAKANNYDLIVDGTIAAYVSPDADVTNAIIVEMDNIWKSRGSKF